MKVTKKVYKIMQPNGTYKSTYDILYNPHTKMYVVTNSRVFICGEEDKNKILLFKGCHWIETYAEFDEDPTPPNSPIAEAKGA